MCVFIEIFQLKFTKRYLIFFLHFPFRETMRQCHSSKPKRSNEEVVICEQRWLWVYCWRCAVEKNI